MKKRLHILLAAILCLTLLLPASVSAAAEDVPQTLRYGNSEYQLISGNYYALNYQIGTAYIFAAKSGSTYYALGTNLGAVALTLRDGVLSADSGVAEVVPESGNFRDAHQAAKIGDNYLTITALNGPLALLTEKAFLWNFIDRTPSDAMAMFYGSVSTTDTSVSGCLTFQDGSFGSTQWGSMTEDNLCIYQKVCVHANREVHAAAAASCSTGGSLAHGYCPDCGSWLNEAGESNYTENGIVCRYTETSFTTYPTGHHYVNGVCTYDSRHIALEYEPVTAGMNLFDEGYLYLIAAPTGGSGWKVMGFDSQGEDVLYPGPGTGCTAVMGSDGKLRIDNANDGTWSAAEFRLNAYPDDAIPIIRVPVNNGSGEYDWGLRAPDNGSDICIPYTDTGYIMADNAWRPIEDPGEVNANHHPYAILVRPDGIAEIRMMTFSDLISPITYGNTELHYASGVRQLTCFYSPGFSSDPSDGSGAPNVRLFRAKAPVQGEPMVNAQITGGSAAFTILSDTPQDAVLAVGYYDAEGRMTAFQSSEVTLLAGTTQHTFEGAVTDAPEYRVFLLERGSLRPLSVKRYTQGA